ncbi:MAG: hypothetical protein KDE51_16255, partial [Anaerolineales bacterium]|nr:hypothetical protein [Anaerolineales bacterium]
MPNEQDQPTPQSTNFTAGRDIDIEVGGDFIGRDKITTTYHYDGLTVEQVAELVVQLKHQDQPTVWNGRIPYLGLSAFQESDAEFFFGRETLVEELLGQVQTSTFITVSGPSGSGKSSIVRAGLFHALRHGRLDKSDQWLLATMTPQGNPQEQLALAVGRTTKSAAARDAIRQNLQAFPDQVDIHLSDDKRQRFVLLVDQFEETFTQTKEPDQRSAFIDLLTQVVAPANGRIIVILSLRSDFISNCSVYPALREKLSRQFQLVGAMSPQDLAKAITLPALTVGAEIDPALVSRIITDMKGEPGALPLMSFALRDLFEAQKSQQGAPMAMTLPEYLARGGLESALERHAQKVFETFTPEQVALAKNIFSKLIEVGQGRVDTRHTAAFEELIPAEQTADETQTVINALAGEGARLITTSGQDDDRTVTIAHERLIDAWPWLRQLVDENRELIALQNQITRDAQAWAKDKDDGFLYRGGRLLQIEEQLQELQPNLNTLANEFVQVSIRQQEKEKQEREAQQQKEIQYLQEQAEAASNLRKRLFQILSIAMVAVIFLIAAVFFGISSSRNAAVAVNNAITATIAQGNAEEQAVAAQNNAVTATIAQGEALQQAATATVAQGEALQQAATATVAQGEALQQAQLAFSRQLAAQAVSELGGVNRDLPLVLAIEAGKVADTSEAFSAIQAAIAQPGQPLKIFQHEGDVSQAQWNSSGNRILTSSSDGTAGIWDAETGNQLAVFQHDEPINYATWNGDESRVLTSSADGTARIWDAGIGDQLAVFQHDDGEVVTRAIWNPIETQILTISSDNTIRVWDVDGEAQLAIFQHERDVLGAVWNNTGSRILTSSVDGTARVWDVENEEEMVRLDHGPWVVSQASWNSDETLILTSSGSGFVGVWNAESGDQVFSL